VKPWSAAWAGASLRFWTREKPTDHFATSSGGFVADVLVGEIRRLDEQLDRPDTFTIVDVGAGDGSLLRALAERVDGELSRRLRLIGVDVRPDRLPGIEWITARWPGESGIDPIVGLVMAHEWLDEIPCDVVERDADGIDRIVLVDEDGREHLGPAADSAARAWMRRWWPLTEPGQRAEIGQPRDEAWRWLTGQLVAGAAVATDYGHVRADRPERWPAGTLAAYRGGRIVPPVPDGNVNITAHVAMDSCADAVPGTTMTTQREMLSHVTIPQSQPAQEFADRSALRRLRDPAGAGAFTWLRWETP